MKQIELNRIALWRPKLIDELTVRESGVGRIYTENHIIKKTTQKTYRYAKNYTKKAIKFCLFVLTYCDDAKGVEKQLDKIAKKIDDDFAKQVVGQSTTTTFEYTDFYLEEK
ncbi:MAG: hypothetical protein J6X18_12655 [Bacteroidales bacterium]|nr:hypothetical protein [Bacteroidales bacterium]